VCCRKDSQKGIVDDVPDGIDKVDGGSECEGHSQYINVVELIVGVERLADGHQPQGAKAVRDRGVLPGSALGFAHRVLLNAGYL
jgi:hypothetical protein